jgi:hypothetical protein
MHNVIEFERHYNNNYTITYELAIDYEVDPPVADSWDCPGHDAILRIEKVVITWRRVEEPATEVMLDELGIGWQVWQEVSEEICADKKLFEMIEEQIKEILIARAK